MTSRDLPCKLLCLFKIHVKNRQHSALKKEDFALSQLEIRSGRNDNTQNSGYRWTSSSNILGASLEFFLLENSTRAACSDEEMVTRQLGSVLAVLTAALVMHRRALRATGRRAMTGEERPLKISAIKVATSALISAADTSLFSISNCFAASTAANSCCCCSNCFLVTLPFFSATSVRGAEALAVMVSTVSVTSMPLSEISWNFFLHSYMTGRNKEETMSGEVKGFREKAQRVGCTVGG